MDTHYCIQSTSTNSPYHFLCITLYSTNYYLLCVWLFFILNFSYFISKVKSKYGKYWLVEYRMIHKKWYRRFVFTNYVHPFTFLHWTRDLKSRFPLKVMISSPSNHHSNTKKWMYVLCVQTWVWNTHHSKEKILWFLWLKVLNMFYFVIHKQNNKLTVGTKLTVNWK